MFSVLLVSFGFGSGDGIVEWLTWEEIHGEAFGWTAQVDDRLVSW